MSVRAIHSPSLLSPFSPGASESMKDSVTPFHHQPTYISLSRMLTRYQHILLLQPPSESLTPLQQQIQSELRSPLPFHRTKWLHNIEHARTLLLQLEHAAQGIKFQRQKREAIHDLAEKRGVIKKLRRHVEEIGREVEAMGEAAWELDDSQELGETIEEILGQPLVTMTNASARSTQRRRGTSALEAGKTVSTVEEKTSDEGPPSESKNTEPTGKTPTSPDTDTNITSTSTTTRRRRRGKSSSDQPPQANSSTTGADFASSTEAQLASSSRLHEDLTTSLVSMAAQLKQQARNLSASLDSDKNLLNRALDGLDRNVSGMAAASKNMAFLRRMSEGQGWLGRLKLYAMILGLWTVAIMLVFIGPKFRF